MRVLCLPALLVLCCAAVHAEALDQMGKPVDQSVVPGSEVRFKVSLPGAKDNVKVARLQDGSLVYIVKRLGAGTDRMLTPEEFSRFYYGQEAGRGWLFVIFNVTSAAGLGLGCGWTLGPIALHRAYARPMADEREKQALGCAGFILVDEPRGRDDAARLLYLETRYCRHSWPSYRLDHLYPQSCPDPSLAKLMESTRRSALAIFSPRSQSDPVLSSFLPFFRSYSWAWKLAGNPSPATRSRFPTGFGSDGAISSEKLPWLTSSRKCAPTGTWMRCFWIAECIVAANWPIHGRTPDTGVVAYSGTPIWVNGSKQPPPGSSKLRTRNLEARVDEVIGLFERAQQPDGYVNSHILTWRPQHRFKNLRDLHELYCAGHLIEAAVVHFEATGKDRLLRVARRFADYIDSRFGREPGKIRGYCGHPEIELALLRLYHLTKERRYLDLCRYFIDERGQSPHLLRPGSCCALGLATVPAKPSRFSLCVHAGA